MRRRTLLLGAAILAAAACQREAEKRPAGDPSIPDPSAVIAPLYQPYLANGVLVGLQDQAPWSASMRDALVAMMARSEAANAPILDFDPLIGAQDYQLSGLSVTTDNVVANSHAVVRAHFANAGRETEILYDMLWQDGAWRVDNIRGADWDLRQIAGQTPSTLPPS